MASLESIYRRYILRARSTNNHFVFSRDYVVSLKLGKIEALFLQDIINLASMSKAIIDDDGWFLCTSHYLERSLDWKPATQTRLIQSLVKRKYIDLDKRGLPPKRWLYIDILRIERDIDKAKTKSHPDEDNHHDAIKMIESCNAIKMIESIRSKRSTMKESDTNVSDLNKKKERAGGRPARFARSRRPTLSQSTSTYSNGKSTRLANDHINQGLPFGSTTSPRKKSIAELPKFCYRWCDRLRDILYSSNKSIPVGRASRHVWARSFHRLWKDLGKKNEPIDTRLKDYAEFINSIDKPIIKNADEFRQHFVWLGNSIQQAKKHNSTELPDNW